MIWVMCYSKRKFLDFDMRAFFVITAVFYVLILFRKMGESTRPQNGHLIEKACLRLFHNLRA